MSVARARASSASTRAMERRVRARSASMRGISASAPPPAKRANRVIWLNPEPQSLWGTGDSDIFKYMPYCHLVTTCNTVASLERVVDDILRAAQ